ncbi:MAG TPA: efflux transporter outer membrane subunit [Burkholderiales bacterium]
MPRNLLPAAAFAVLLSGCAVGPDFLRPANHLFQAMLSPKAQADGERPSALAPQPVPVAWWTLFNDPELTVLQTRARSANLDLQAAAARVEESRAQLGIAQAALFPHSGFGADKTRQALSADGPLHKLGASTRPFDLYNANFDAGWEIDLWGKARRAGEGAGALAEASLYDREAVRVAVSAEIARNYLLLRGNQAQLDITRQNRRIAEHALRLAQSREQNGVATRFDTAAARAQLANIKATLPQLSQRRDALMNALALLLGEAPRRLDAELTSALPLPAMPARVPVGLPSELAQRRPDILRAEARLHAATAAIGVAKADFYPRIGLKGTAGWQAFNFHDMGSWGAQQFTFGPTLYLPIFEGGRLKSTLALTEARQKSAAIAYQQTVLSAWHEVDNALGAWAAEQQRHEELVIAAEQDRIALTAAERAYREGAADYLTVLVAQRNLLAGQLALSDSATAATLAVVGLYKSLGGGWDPAALDQADPPKVSAGLDSRQGAQP